jgi:uncharacterized membrane protein
MNELDNSIRKYRAVAGIFDIIIILAIAAFFLWQYPAVRIAVKLFILRTGIYQLF